MRTVDEFVKGVVTIDFLEDFNCYGHYPFQMFVETENGQFEMVALALGGDVASCYRCVRKYLKRRAKRIFMSLDFSAFLDAKRDFVAVFAIENNKIDLFAIPYDEISGEKFEIIQTGGFLSKILLDIRQITGLQ